MVRLRQPVAVVLSSILLTTPVHAQTAPVVVAPGTGNTRVATSPGGVTIVDIATPNAAGLSQNRYTNFNVPAQGVVLNNTDPTKFTWASQLAGSVTANFNIDRPAAVILNEVVAPNPTTIAGTTEVAGTKADVVIANQYGIAVNGGTFLNTDQVTLTTGAPLLGANGSLSGFRVGSGQIVISGAGLNASNLDYLNLVARSLRFDGQVNAKTLTAVAGAADYNYASRTAATNSSASGTAPTYAIDSTALGGMYADRIRFVATDAGIGVRMANDVAATADDFTVNSAGRIQITGGHHYAARDLALTSSGGVEISGANTALTAKQDLALTATGSDVKLTDAALVAGRNFSLTGATLADSATSQPTQATRFALADLVLNFSGASTVDRSAYGSGGSLALRTGSLAATNAAAFYSGADSTRADRSMTLRATTGDLDLGNAQVTSPATLALTADAGAVRTATGGNIQASGSLAIATSAPFVNAGTLQSGGDLTIRSVTGNNLSIVNRGNLIAAGDLFLPGYTSAGAIATAASIDNSGAIGGRNVEVRAATVTNSGVIQATRGLTVAATTLTNTSDGVILTATEAGRKVYVNAGTLNNSGYIQATGDLFVTVTGDTSNSGVLATVSSSAGGTDGLTSLTSRAVTNSGSIQSAGDLAVTASAGVDNSGALQAAGLMTLSVGPVLNNYAAGSAIATGNLTVGSPLSAFSLSNAGRLQSGGNLTLGSSGSPVALTQSATGVSLATGTLQATASTIDNAGTLQSGGALTLTASGAVVNSSGATILTTGAAAPIGITAASLNNAGSIQSAGSLTSTTTGAFTNSGAIATTGNLTGNASTFTNSGTVSSGANLALTATNTSGTTLTNSGTLQAVGSLAFVTPGALSNTTVGRILAGTSATLTGGNAAFSVNNAGLVQAGTTLSVGNTSNRVALVNGGTLLAVGALDATVSTASNQGTIQSGGALTVAATGALTNSSGAKILTAGASPTDVTLTAASLDNAGTIQSTGAIASTTTGATSNSGSVLTTGTGAINVTAATVANSGTAKSGSALNVTATNTSGTTLTNSGTLESATTLAIVAPSALSNTSAGKILAGTTGSITGGGTFSFTNDGLVQAGTTLDVGATTGRVALVNNSGAALQSGNALTVRASSIANSGTIQGSPVLLDVTGALTQTATGATLTVDSAADLTANAASLTNAGTFQSARALALTVSGATTNSGKLVTTGTGNTTLTTGTLDNSGTVSSGGNLTVTAQTTGGTSLANSGTLQATGAVALVAPGTMTNSIGARVLAGTTGSITGGGAAFTLTNGGTIQTGTALTLGGSAARAALSNGVAGLINAGTTLDAFTSTAANTGTVQSAGNLTLDASGAITNNSPAKFLTTGTGAALALTGASLTNDGAIQSAGTVNASLTGAVTNSGTVTSLGTGTSGALTLAAGTSLTNTGKLAAGGAGTFTAGTTFANNDSGQITAAGDLALTTGSSFTNAAAAKVIGGAAVAVHGASNFTFANSGLVQGTGAVSIGDTAQVAAFTNAAGASVLGNSFNVKAGSFTNNGLIQADTTGSITVANGATLTNAAGAKIVTDGALTLDSASGNFSLANSGIVQGGGTLTIGGGGRTAAITNATGAKIFAGQFAVSAGAIDNSGLISGSGGGTISGTTFLNNGSDSRFIFATDAGAGTLNLTGAFTNQGAAFSNATYTINAASITNTGTGGISSFGGLNLNATGGNLTNDGALYSTGTMNLGASGNISNGADATIDTDGDFTATATNDGSTFTNTGQINIAHNATFNVRNFRNILPGAENVSVVAKQPTMAGLPITSNFIVTTGALPSTVADRSLTEWYLTSLGEPYGHDLDFWAGTVDFKGQANGTYYVTEKLVDGSGNYVDPNTLASTPKPQISVGGAMTLQNMDTGINRGGLITVTGALTITGRPGASFVNDSLALTQSTYSYTAVGVYKNRSALGSAVHDVPLFRSADAIQSETSTFVTAETYFTKGAGIRAGSVSVTNVANFTNLGTPLAVATNSTSASSDTKSTLTSKTDAGAVTVSDTSISIARVDAGATGARIKTGGSDLGATATSSAAGRSTVAALNALNRASNTVALNKASFSINGLTIKLPTNPNGLFVTSVDPNAKFLVTANATFGLSTTTRGSNQLIEDLGLDPEVVQKRLGDASYEQYLVRQQLAELAGTRLLTGYTNESKQFEALMHNAADEARRLGLVFGQPLSDDALKHLDRDIVWMVDEVIGGQHVLVPRVYLSEKTKSLFDDGNATIAAAGDMKLDVGNLTNTGGNLTAGKNLSVNASGDIKNTSGTISGNNVSLKAGGSITNETKVYGDQSNTTLGRTATIKATNNLALDAGKDLTIKGGDVSAGGDADINVKGNILVDTVEKRTTTTETKKSKENQAALGNVSFETDIEKTTTKRTVEQQGSNLSFGKNVKISSGGNTTLAGSNLTVGGNLDTDIKGDLNIEARQNSTEVTTSTSKTGVGVGGGIYGKETTTVSDFDGKNKGSKISVGGNANLSTDKTLKIEGSELDLKGDATLSANDVKILDGKDEHRTTTTKTSVAFGAYTDSSSSSSAKGEANAFGNKVSGTAASGKDATTESEEGHTRLSAGAEGSANAQGSAGVTLGVRTTSSTSTDYESKSVGSKLGVGGNLTVKAKNNLQVKGSDIEAKGDVNLDAKNMTFEAGEDVKTHSESSSTTTVGLRAAAEGSATAKGEAKAGPTAANSEIKGDAGGEASVTIHYDRTDADASSGSSKARVSTIKSGGNLTRTAQDTIKDVGTKIDVGGDLNQSATTITSEAAADRKWSNSSSETNSADLGAYVDAKAKTKVEAETSTAVGGGMNSGAGAEAGASASFGGKMEYNRDTKDASSSSSKAVVSTIKVGGKVNSTSSGKTTLEGTKITSGGDVTIDAGSLEYKAAKNTSTSSSDSSNINAEMKGGYGINGSASTEGGSSGSTGAQGSLSGGYKQSESSKSSSEAVVGELNAGGKLTIKTKGDARFEGTNLESKGDASIKTGGNLTFDEARSTSSTSSDGFNASATLSGSKTRTGSETKNSVGLGVSGGYNNAGKSEDKAVTGSIKSGGALSIETGGNASFTGTDLTAKDDMSIDAKGSVDFKQATSTTSETSTKVAAKLDGSLSGTSGSKSSATGDVTSKSQKDGAKGAGAVEGEYSTSNESTAKTSSLNAGGKFTIKSGGDTTLQGTQIEAGKDVKIDAGGNLNLKAAEESSSSFGVSGSLDAKGSTSKKTTNDTNKAGDNVGTGTQRSHEGEAGGTLNVEGQKSTTQTGVSIKSGGGTDLSAGKDVKMVGTKVDSTGDINVTAGGKVTQTDAVSSESGGSLGVSGKVEGKSGSNSGTGTQAPKDSKPGEKTKPSAGVTDVGFNSDKKEESVELKSGTGKVTVKENTPPATEPKSSTQAAPASSDPKK